MAELGAKAVKVRIEGRVQGVGYRAWAIREARARGLAGWVRNRTDGSVEALIAGPAPAVEAMVEACRRGPRAAAVRQVSEMPANDPRSDDFVQRPTV
jgi:acylphosphatase